MRPVTTTERTMYVKPADKQRLQRIAERETRRPSDQLTLILNEWAAGRGLDPATFEPVARSA